MERKTFNTFKPRLSTSSTADLRGKRPVLSLPSFYPAVHSTVLRSDLWAAQARTTLATSSTGDSFKPDSLNALRSLILFGSHCSFSISSSVDSISFESSINGVDITSVSSSASAISSNASASGSVRSSVFSDSVSGNSS